MSVKEIAHRLKGIILFGIVYLAAFFFMEARDVPIHIIHTAFDDMIPFCKYFIIPYVIWYFYVGATILYLAFTDRGLKEYNRFILMMELGMIVFVIVSFVYPNGQDLRPQIVVTDWYTGLINLLYTVDTSTNILPSLHVYASVACCIALCRDKNFRKKPALQWITTLLTVSICLSTMFIKQHSVIDVTAALLFNGLFYSLVYQPEYSPAKITMRKKAIQKT